jgi:hypothetical protein
MLRYNNKFAHGKSCHNELLDNGKIINHIQFS